MNRSPYQMGIGLSVVPYVGPDLYSNVPAVISELVANAWDAGATQVKIKVDIPNETIVIEDNGKGMSLDTMNNKYLWIGFKKRKKDEINFQVNGKLRHVMGRKGIGKLAPFALAETLKVESFNGEEKAGCIVKWSELKQSIDNDEATFNPVAIPNPSLSYQGTRLTLQNIRSDKRSLFEDLPKLRREIAKRFNIIDKQHDFDVQVNDVSISDTDRPYLEKLEFVWHIGERDVSFDERCSNLQRSSNVIQKSVIYVDGQKYQVSGWIGTVETPSDLNKFDSNTISIFAHGKLIQEDILSELNERQIFVSYVVGNLQADFMDDDDEEDIVTPDRQRLNQSDPRYERIKNYVKNEMLAPIAPKWSLWRKERGIGLALTIPELAQWYESLSKKKKGDAATIFKNIINFHLSDEQRERFLLLVPQHFSQIRKTSGFKNLDFVGFRTLIDKLTQPSKNHPTGDKNPKQQSTSENPNPSTSEGSTTTTPTNDNPEQSTTSEETTSSDSGDATNTTNTTDTSSDNQEEPKQSTDNTQSEDDDSEERESDRILSQIQLLIDNLPIEDNYRNIIFYDLGQARLAYKHKIYKASIVMLGAALEGIMLATLRREDVIHNLSAMPPQNIKFHALKSVVFHPQLDPNRVADTLVREFRFEEYRQLMELLIPALAQLQVKQIQQFRNSIHPSKSVEQPEVYATPDYSSVIGYLAALKKITETISGWEP